MYFETERICELLSPAESSASRGLAYNACVPSWHTNWILLRSHRTVFADRGMQSFSMADGVHYDPGEVDAIFINAGVTHPQSLWLDRLRTDGRLLVPITFTPPSVSGSGQGNIVTGHGNMLLVRTRSPDGSLRVEGRMAQCRIPQPFRLARYYVN